MKYFAERGLDEFSKRYGYDVSYMRHMLDVSPAAFNKFAKLTDLSQHNESVPKEALYAAKIVGAVSEDCGPCVQLNVDMAREAGVAADQIEAILKRAPSAMSEDAALGFCFAEAMVHKLPSADEARESVRAQWGDAGVIDLTLAAQISRLFPMVKTALGFGKTCQKVTIDEGTVDVIKSAA